MTSFTGTISSSGSVTITSAKDGKIIQSDGVKAILDGVQKARPAAYDRLKSGFSAKIEEKGGSFEITFEASNVKSPFKISRTQAAQINPEFAPPPSPTNWGAISALTLLSGLATAYYSPTLAALPVAIGVAGLVRTCLSGSDKKPQPAAPVTATAVLAPKPATSTTTAAPALATAVKTAAIVPALISGSAPKIDVQVMTDICDLKVDAIVNAANGMLLGGGAIDGHIHNKAGPQLLKECQAYRAAKSITGPVEDGHAMITSSGNLAPGIKHIIHAVGPVWNPANAAACDKALYDAYYNSLLRADEKKLTSIAFPSISTGVFGFPKDRAAPIAMKAARQFIADHPQTTVKSIIFALRADTASFFQSAVKQPMAPAAVAPTPIAKPTFTVIHGNPRLKGGALIPLQIGTVGSGPLTDANFGQVAKTANQYTLNQPYASASNHFVYKGQTIYRPNHNGTHSARQARTLEAVFQMVESKGDSTVKGVYKGLSEEEKMHLKLGAYFMRAGRSDESSHKSASPDDYYTRSAMIYEAYARQLGTSETTIQWVKKLIVNSCKPQGVRDADIDSNPKNKFGYECLTIVHELDLIRCFDQVAFGVNTVNSIQSRLDTYFVKKPALNTHNKLVQFARDLCIATGSTRIFDNAIGNSDIFVPCSLDGERCWNTVKGVALPVF